MKYQCPECDEYTIEVSIEVDRNYGADADGRRGISVTWTEVDSQECECELSDKQIEAVCEDAVESHSNG